MWSCDFEGRNEDLCLQKKKRRIARSRRQMLKRRVHQLEVGVKLDLLCDKDVHRLQDCVPVTGVQLK